jgi:hypothetical protein
MTVHILKPVPAGIIQHPRKEFHKVSTWISSSSEALDELIKGFDVVILLGLDRKVDHKRQTESLTLRSAEDACPIVRAQQAHLCLCLMEVLNTALIKSFVGGFAHPTPAE